MSFRVSAVQAVVPVVVAVVSDPNAQCILIIAPHGSYRTFPFIEAARELGLHSLIASEGRHSIVSAYSQGIHVDFSDPDSAFDEIVNAIVGRTICGVIATDDSTTELAARISRYLSLPHNDPNAVKITQRKDLARDVLQAKRVPKPSHRRIDTQQVLDSQLRDLNFPVVVKPVSLSASRGVIRANDPTELRHAIERVCRLLGTITDLDADSRRYLLIEEFVYGQEVAVEAMLYNGKLDILTVFDKPDPLDGPYFEETLYVTPSRHAASTLARLTQVIQQACDAYGLTEGPIHAECRINDLGVFVLEVAARTIGGMCGRLLQFGTGHSLEQLVVSHAMGRRVSTCATHGAAGVLMIPIPKAGLLKRVEGLLAAQQVRGISEVNIQIREGHELVPLPEGASYLGFVFASGETVQQVEDALREAHTKLHFVIAPVWKLTQGNLACQA